MTSGSWWSLSLPGVPRPIPALVRAWLSHLLRFPGEPLVLELGTGTEREVFQMRSPFPPLAGIQDAWARECLRAVPVAPPEALPSPWDGVGEAGCVVWSPPGSGGEVSGYPPRPPIRSICDTQGSESPPDIPRVPPPWAVQALFVWDVPRGDRPPRLFGHIRWMSGPRGTSGSGRLAHHWAILTGGRPLVLRTTGGLPPGWKEEWTQRSVFRFHSGRNPCPPAELLARPWFVPGEGSGALRLPRTGSILPVGDSRARAHLGARWNGDPGGSFPWSQFLRHAAVLGSSGSGKTQFLIHLATTAILAGIPVVLWDLHGDLGPGVVSRLPPPRRMGLVLLDGTRGLEDGLVGIDVLGSGGGSSRGTPRPSEEWIELLTSEVLEALRPLPGRGEEYWGPRLERILDGAIRSVVGAGGDLAEVADLLFRPASSTAPLLASVREPNLREFLEGLPALARRQPEFLSSAQNRLARAALSPRFRRVVAPGDGGIDPADLLRMGRSLIIHLPREFWGAAAGRSLANLLLMRVFLSLLRRGPTSRGAEVRALLVLDEAQSYAPSLLRTLVEEGRKFGVGVVMATQSLSHLEEGLGRGTLANVQTLFVLRTPAEEAPRLSTLLGLVARAGPIPPMRMEEDLTILPTHMAWVRGEGMTQPQLWMFPPPEPVSSVSWQELSDRSAQEFCPSRGEGTASPESLLLKIAASGGNPHGRELPGAEGALRRGWIHRTQTGSWDLTEAGWARLGLSPDSGAPRESEEHRQLVAIAFRIFARHALRLILPRQGGFERTQPDAWIPLPPTPEGGGDPSSGSAGEGLRWLLRLGHGRPIFVEAEVSSLRDPRRLARTWQKAQRAGAHLLLLTGTSAGGKRLRRFLRTMGATPRDATVWVLRPRREVPFLASREGSPPAEERGVASGN